METTEICIADDGQDITNLNDEDFETLVELVEKEKFIRNS